VNWLFFALAGSIAQLIDGALGMGFGLTSSTLLLTLGTSAAVASAAVHAAEIGTTLASGVSHWHRENVDYEILKRLAIPGGVGAFAGATFLSSIDLSGGKIFISTILLLLGFVLLYRNVFQTNIKANMAEINNPRYLTFLGATGGFVDASGGGDIDWSAVGGLALGGVLMAPIAAKLVSVVPRRPLGIAVAVAIIVINGVRLVTA